MWFQKKPIKILSVDAGGIRGLIPLYILREIEKRLGARRIRKPFVRIFDLMAGTSTGGLIVLGIAAPRFQVDPFHKTADAPEFTVANMIDFYEKNGITIFPHRFFEQLSQIAHVFHDKYSAQPLEELMAALFGKRKLSQALTNVLIPAFDIENQKPYIFRSRTRQNKKAADTDFYMKDVVRATTAAPTFFEPAVISSVPPGKKDYCFIDGAVFAHNPALAAYVEARALFGKKRKIMILSLGTGAGFNSYNRKKIKHWGYLDWITPAHGSPLPNIMIDGEGKSTDYYLSSLEDVMYFKINDQVKECSESFDDATERNVDCIKAHAMELIRRNDALIDKIVTLLAK
jgi:uncharacterized protein